MVHPYLEYKINYDYISQVLCVNKRKPDLHCEGKCHLAMEIKKVAKEGSDKKEVSVGHALEIILNERLNLTFTNPLLYIIKPICIAYSQLLLSASFEILAPPPKA